MVFGWGLNDERLCSKSNQSDKAPRRYLRHKVLGQLTPLQITRVACGNSYSLALSQSGKVYSWGIGKSGSLGLGEISTIAPFPHVLSFQNISDDSSVQGALDPESKDDSDKIIAIDSGQTHCMALAENGSVYTWGNGQSGRLGHGDEIGQNVPEKV